MAGLPITTEPVTSAGTALDRRELINEWGTAIEAAAADDHPSVAVHDAAIHRTVREFDRRTTHME